ncbi:DUF4282 domain-containing protein [Actinomadura macra]|uniref:DUF4282 domain-containing protein n=1 Tax=Actinomadura macra TaxID=46164 RepID=UPI00082D8E4B|nr:DUF4282 domain-containing protein [Actinomadura macra]
MTHPSDPGHPPRPPRLGPQGDPYVPQQQPAPGPRPPSFHPGPGPGPQGQPREWVPVERTDKGLFGALLDANFNHLVTLKLAKVSYVLSLMLISLQCLLFLGLGAWIATWDDFWAWGIFLLIATPLVWLSELLLVRLFMEAVVVRFKTAEHLRVIKDKI